jgi:hyperosmotically inducible periplasmic protein
MSDRDPLAPNRQGLNEEDLALLGQEDPDEMANATDDPMVAADSAEPYVPPTDPPVVPKGGPDNIEVADGFASTSEGAEERAGVPGDAEITERVKDLLRTDAGTSTLDLDVETIDGVVYLRGTVPSLEDTDLAAEVAARVPGVVDVVDEMTVQE